MTPTDPSVVDRIEHAQAGLVQALTEMAAIEARLTGTDLALAQQLTRRIDEAAVLSHGLKWAAAADG